MTSRYTRVVHVRRPRSYFVYNQLTLCGRAARSHAAVDEPRQAWAPLCKQCLRKMRVAAREQGRLTA